MAPPLSDSALDQLFREARSYNGWLDKPVTDDQLHTLWDLMKMGPTSANQLPARIVWCKTAEAKARLAGHAGENNRAKIVSAPVCAILAMDIDFHEQLPWLFPHTDARSWFAGDEAARRQSAFRNSTLQGAYMILAARAIGLDCGPMSTRRSTRISSPANRSGRAISSARSAMATARVFFLAVRGRNSRLSTRFSDTGSAEPCGPSRSIAPPRLAPSPSSRGTRWWPPTMT